MKRVIVIGNAGSGKSWLSLRISQALKINEVNLDKLVWETGGYHTKRPESVVKEELKAISNVHSWVVEGVFGDLVEHLIDVADTLIFLDLPWELCEASLILRGAENDKQKNTELADKNFQELLIWASNYRTRQTKSSYSFHLKLFEEFPGVKYRFTQRPQVDAFIKHLDNYRATH